MDELEINRLLDTLKDTFVFVMKKIDLDSSDLVKKSKFTFKDETINISMGDYADYVDKGRKKGRMPPVNDIVKWMQDKGISAPSGSTLEQVAWAIAKSISKKGIKPKPFLDKLHEEVTDITLRYMYAQLNKELTQTFKNK